MAGRVAWLEAQRSVWPSRVTSEKGTHGIEDLPVDRLGGSRPNPVSKKVLKPFQNRFVSAVLRPDIRRAVLSLPRGNGKSWLAGFLAAEALRPGGALFRAGDENVLLSGSFDQARYVYRFAKGLLGDRGYAYQDNKQQMGIHHRATGTRLLVKSSRARGAFGLVGARIALADEPGAWDTVGGELMADALDTALGKPESDLTVVYIGTLAPAMTGWWASMVRSGSVGSTYVQALEGDPAKWDRWPEIRRCNPLMSCFTESRETLLEERDAARRDSRLKARFLSYRLNCPTEDSDRVLLTVDEWKRVLAREVPDRRGRPVVGVDCGAGRAWSAASAVWPSGRVEAVAIAPGTPTLAEQEKRDQVPTGTYQKLEAAGVLTTDGDRRVPRVSELVKRIMPWRPASLTCDRFRIAEFQDAVRGRVTIRPRIQRWSEASEDVRATRRLALDGPLAIATEARGLLTASLAASKIESDTGGSLRLIKRSTNNQGRDDAAIALVLACGAHTRRRRGAVGIVRSMLCGADA